MTAGALELRSIWSFSTDGYKSLRVGDKAAQQPQMPMPYTVSTEQLSIAADALRRGELVAFPTETVYGLGADARNSAAVRRIYEAKGRPSNNPLIVHIPSVSAIELHTDLSRAFDPVVVRERLAKLAHLWPGPLSVVLPASSAIAPEVGAGGDTVALRIPAHPVALELLRVFGGPIAAPSANLSNYVSPTTAEHVRQSLGQKVACILDGGPCQVGLESTVLSLINPIPKVLRPGAVTRSQLEAALGCAVDGPSKPVGAELLPLLSPGLLEKHYSPRTPVILKSALHRLGLMPKRVGVILFAPQELPFVPTHSVVLSPSGEPAAVAAGLFSALREMDSKGLELIVVDTCEPVGLGEAIMDRLIRAAG